MTSQNLSGPIGFVGMGLIGTSLAACVSEACPDIALQALERSPAHARTASAMLANLTIVQSVEELADCQIVFICTPVSAIADYVIALAALLGPDALIVDTGSSKAEIISQVQQTLPDFDRFVPGHPIAGSHIPGPGMAHADILREKPFMLSPYAATSGAAVQRVTNLLSHCRLEIATVDPELHDRILAQSSHLPHAIAFSMVNQIGDTIADPANAALIANSFKKMTTFAASDVQMWQDIFLSNDKALLNYIADFKAHLEQLEHALSNRDAAALAQLLSRANHLRKEID